MINGGAGSGESGGELDKKKKVEVPVVDFRGAEKQSVGLFWYVRGDRDFGAFRIEEKCRRFERPIGDGEAPDSYNYWRIRPENCGGGRSRGWKRSGGGR